MARETRSAGLRVSELAGLNVDDLDLDGGVLTVRGKGKKERLALLGGPATKAVRNWLSKRAAIESVDGKDHYVAQYFRDEFLAPLSRRASPLA